MKQTLLLSALLFLQAASAGFAQVPQTISYQGVLTGGDGRAVADGDYTIRFDLYDRAVGGSLLWSESHEATVGSGIFHVILGTITPLDLARKIVEGYAGVVIIDLRGPDAAAEGSIPHAMAVSPGELEEPSGWQSRLSPERLIVLVDGGDGTASRVPVPSGYRAAVLRGVRSGKWNSCAR